MRSQIKLFNSYQMEKFFTDSMSQSQFNSEIRSFTGKELSAHKKSNYHSLPPICQPILSKYRMHKPGNELIIQQTQSLWCSIFGGTQRSSIKLCRCERTQDGHCELVMKWINQYYDWKQDRKFVKTYNNYTRRNIQIFLTDDELINRLKKKLQILGIKLGEKYEQMLVRICKNYIKHTIYYSRSQMLTRQNDIWMWLVIGIFYHMATSLTEQKGNNYEEEIIFWAVDIVMNTFGNLTRNTFHQNIRKIIDLIKDFFPKWYSKIVHSYKIDMEPIIYEWTNEMMMGYMGIDSIGFFIDCLLKKGWTYVDKIILSYFQKRLEKMEHDEIFQSISDKEVILRQLMNCSQQWPLIFCNAHTFVYDKEKSS